MYWSAGYITTLYATSVGTSASRVADGYFTNLSVTNFTLPTMDNITISNTSYNSNIYNSSVSIGYSSSYAAVFDSGAVRRISSSYAYNLGTTAIPWSNLYVTNIGATGSHVTNGYFDTLHVYLTASTGMNFISGTTTMCTIRLSVSDVNIANASGTLRLYTTASTNNDAITITSAGLRIGTATAHRVSFYGATPVARQTGWTNLATTDTLANTITRVNAITTFLRTIGLTT